MRRRPTSLSWALSALSWALLGALGSCGSGAPTASPRWIELARGFRPLAPAAVVEALGAPAETIRDDGEGGAWIDRAFPASAWRPAPAATRPGTYVADLPRALWGPDVGLRPRGGARAGYERVAAHLGESDAPLEPGSYWTRGEALFLVLGPDEEPGELRLSTRLFRGREADGAWRVAVGDWVGDGIPVHPDVGERVRVDLPPASALRFGTAARRFDVEERDRPSAALFRVLLDGREIFRAEQPTHPRERARWHAVPLPPAGRRGAELELRVEGDPASAAFLAPVVGPAEVGGYAARPWDGRGGTPRPSIVLFLADTLRADALAAYGGAPDLAPRLNALAERSRVFTEARAPAAWTLPAQASMLSGLWPEQHGATRQRLPLAAELPTLAERLAEHGWRTGAVTDSGFVSANFGFDQGFAWFEENAGRDLTTTLADALAFLAADDGRPALLFVHTYRTHAPYRTGVEEDAARWDALLARVTEGVQAWAAAQPSPPGREALLARHEQLLGEDVGELRALYDETIRALDAEVGPWLDELERLGVLARGALVFTSDHGEAFLEHGELKHGGRLWDEKLRVPLVVHAPGLAPGFAPGLDPRPASLVDLPRTLAALAGGVEPAPGWGGTSLLAADPAEDRAVWAFGEELPELGSQFVLIDAGRKLFGTLDAIGEAAGGGAPALEHAFDLRADPGEARDVLGQAAWADDLARDLAARLAPVCAPAADPASIQLRKDQADNLQKLGY